MRRGIGVLSVVLVAAVAYGDGFKTLAAKQADVKFEDAKKRAAADYKQAVLEAEVAYRRELIAAAEAAVEARDFDEMDRIRARMKELENSRGEIADPAGAGDDPARALIGKRFDLADRGIWYRFDPDGGGRLGWADGAADIRWHSAGEGHVAIFVGSGEVFIAQLTDDGRTLRQWTGPNLQKAQPDTVWTRKK